MASHLPYELEAGTTDSVASSPRSDHLPSDPHPRVRFMCSFGGKILPRPSDNQLRYVGGDTRIVAVNRSTTFSALLVKLSKLAGSTSITVKYQLPNEDLDSLISVSTDEDVENMMEEYDRLAQALNSRSARLRLFLFTKGDDSPANSISSLLEGSANRENWFFDALNSGAGTSLDRGRSEASSIVSEVPDYLFGLDNNSDESQTPSHPRLQKVKSRLGLSDNVSASDPGSPAPAVSSLFCSTSSTPPVASMPDLPPVKTKPDNPPPVVESKESQSEGFSEKIELTVPQSQPMGYPGGNPVWHYPPPPDSYYPGHHVQPVPVYYVPGPHVQHGSAPVQPVPIRTQYVHQYPAVASGHIPVGYGHSVPGVGQVYSGEARPYDAAIRVVPDGVNQPMYYGTTNAGMVPGYPGGPVMMGRQGDEAQGMMNTSTDSKPGRVSHP